MLLDFFYALREAGVPVSIKEWLVLMDALRRHLAFGRVDDFYTLAKLVLVKDERHFDRFDQVFARFAHGIEQSLSDDARELPEEWLRKQVEKFLSDEEKQALGALGWDKLMETLKERLAEQHGRHQGGNKWIGTGGTSPFGAWGYHPEGIRVGQNQSRHRRAVKVWDKREFRNLDGDSELDTRNLKVALRSLREFAREGSAEVLDLPATIAATAHNAGHLALKMVPELHNAVKVVVLFDIGGSMDDHIRVCESLFAAARSEFKHLETFYFHNCVYETVWRDNARRQASALPVWELIHTYGQDYKLVIVGDATMSPYEIAYPGGSVERMNEEAGEVWLKRLTCHFRHAAWLNPEDASRWPYVQSIAMLQERMEGRMFPLTVDGLTRAMRGLRRG